MIKTSTRVSDTLEYQVYCQMQDARENWNGYNYRTIVSRVCKPITLEPLDDPNGKGSAVHEHDEEAELCVEDIEWECEVADEDDIEHDTDDQVVEDAQCEGPTDTAIRLEDIEFIEVTLT